MNIYISGISGTGMGPLALMAKSAGYQVFGSDLQEGPVTAELRAQGISFHIGPQDGDYLHQVHSDTPIDWFVYTSALPADHPELTLASQLDLKTTKRDQLISHLVKELNLKMIAVAGTHGKTTTTSMLIWVAQELHLPAAYLVGTTLPFAPAGSYTTGDQFFIYEADEYDRNFLHFHPWLSIIPSISYDHPDIYPTQADYDAAFDRFKSQSKRLITSEKLQHFHPDDFSIAGPARRLDAALAAEAILEMTKEDASSITNILNHFPGTGRRFERLAPGVYTDYAHHPEEITATIAIAKEEATRNHLKGVVAIYQPHQNTRQHQVREGYRDAFLGVDRLFWLPTYLTREDPNLPIITPAEFITDLHLESSTNDSPQPPIAQPAKNLDEIADQLRSYHDQGYLLLLMTAGPADAAFRQLFSSKD